MDAIFMTAKGSFGVVRVARDMPQATLLELEYAVNTGDTIAASILQRSKGSSAHVET